MALRGLARELADLADTPVLPSRLGAAKRAADEPVPPPKRPAAEPAAPKRVADASPRSARCLRELQALAASNAEYNGVRWRGSAPAPVPVRAPAPDPFRFCALVVELRAAVDKDTWASPWARRWDLDALEDAYTRFGDYMRATHTRGCQPMARPPPLRAVGTATGRLARAIAHVQYGLSTARQALIAPIMARIAGDKLYNPPEASLDLVRSLRKEVLPELPPEMWAHIVRLMDPFDARAYAACSTASAALVAGRWTRAVVHADRLAGPRPLPLVFPCIRRIEVACVREQLTDGASLANFVEACAPGAALRFDLGQRLVLDRAPDARRNRPRELVLAYTPASNRSETCAIAPSLPALVDLGGVETLTLAGFVAANALFSAPEKHLTALRELHIDASALGVLGTLGALVPQLARIAITDPSDHFKSPFKRDVLAALLRLRGPIDAETGRPGRGTIHCETKWDASIVVDALADARCLAAQVVDEDGIRGDFVLHRITYGPGATPLGSNHSLHELQAEYDDVEGQHAEDGSVWWFQAYFPELCDMPPPADVMDADEDEDD